jgi:pentatricopeptide repeat protein
MLASYKRGEKYAEARAILDEMLKAGLDPGPVSLPN